MIQKNPNKQKNNFSCKLCNYNTCSRKDFNKHIKTKKHGTKWYTQVSTKRLYYECANCDYISCNIDDFNTHLSLFSHRDLSLDNEDKKLTTTSVEEKNKCNFCGKIYKYSSGYYRHIKLCKDQKKDNLVKLLIDKTDENNKLCKKIMQLENKQQIIQNTIIHNKQFNINVFLNNDCKNAMNITDFINQIQLSLDDVLYTKDNGYIKGISNIFLKHLEHLKLTERPIHSICDKKSQQFYVKNNEGWECDNKETKIDQTIDTVAKKQILKIKEWENDNPNWNKTDKGINDYMKIVKTLMGGSTEEEIIKNKNLIKKELTENVGLND